MKINPGVILIALYFGYSFPSLLGDKRIPEVASWAALMVGMIGLILLYGAPAR